MDFFVQAVNGITDFGYGIHKIFSCNRRRYLNGDLRKKCPFMNGDLRWIWLSINGDLREKHNNTSYIKLPYQYSINWKGYSTEDGSLKMQINHSLSKPKK